MALGLAYGFFSAALFLLVSLLGLGSLFLFLPALPLLYIGLSGQPRVALIAALIALPPIAFGGGWGAALFFLAVLGLPAWYIGKYGTLWRQWEGQTHWFPLGLLFTRLAALSGGFAALLILYADAQEGGLDAVFAAYATADTLQDIGDERYRQTVEMLLKQWAFIIVASSLWVWNLGLYLHGWIAQRLLMHKARHARPDFAISAFAMPDYMLALLGISALLSLAGGTPAFIGKTWLITLLLPYFYLGAARMHESVRAWPNRGFFLFFIYFLIAVQLWPALLIAGWGVYFHIKRLSGAGSSSRN